ncbi:MAG: purine/pyrimidine permease [Deltaproteobacteria bacterium]|nr:purine/pyrimidine permease [Deltaproteobacteria bacterium]
MEQKPANIIYGVDDIPPFRTTLLLAVQHAILALVFIVYPLMLVSESGGTQIDAEGVVTASILAMAVGTFLQCLGRKGMGSGYLAVNLTTPIYLPVSIQAAKIGGLGLTFGMTVIAGIFSIVFSRFLKHFRHLFPAEVCGVAVVMLGISMVRPAITRFLGLHGGNSVDPHAIAVALITLALMVALSIWPRGKIRLYSVLIGLAAGYGAALWLGVIDHASLQGVMEGGFLALPTIPIPDWKFQWALLTPFLMTALVSSLDTVACIITCQKINQSEWVRPDMAKVSRGVLADGVSAAMAGALGTLGTGVSSAHIALSSATGATARRIGLLTAIVLLATAFVPPIAKLLSRMPAPVIGAVLVYAAAFLITSGMELIVSRMLDTRRIFMVGGSIIVGLAAIQLTELIQKLPPWLYSIVGSPFAVASLCAIVLNLLFRIGTAQNAALRIEPQLTSISEAVRFFESRGGAWGARRQVIQRVQAAVSELLETVILLELAEGNIDIQARFDEYHLDVMVLYSGLPFPASEECPSPEQLLADENAVMRLSGSLIRQYADRVVFDAQKERQRISLHFEH